MKKLIKKPHRFNPKTHFLKVRNTKRYVKKTLSGKKYIYEIYSKKTKRRVGYLNYIDKTTKKPITRTLTKRQINMMSQIKTKRIIKSKKKLIRCFLIHSEDFISAQLDLHQDYIIRTLNRIKKKKYIISAEIESNHFPKTLSQGVVLDRNTRWEFVNDIITKTLIIGVLNTYKQRMSPKNDKNKNKEHLKEIHVCLYYQPI